MSRFFKKTRARLGKEPVALSDNEVRARAERYREGDPEAREQLFRQMTNEGEAIVRKRSELYPVVVMMEETSDILQNALTKLFKRFQAHPEQIPETVKVLRLALNVAIEETLIDACRKHLGPFGWCSNHVLERDSGLDVDAGLTSVTGKARQEETESRLARAIGELPVNHRQALLLREIQGLSFVEISARLGVHRRTAADWCQAALDTLRIHLRDDDPGTP